MNGASTGDGPDCFELSVDGLLTLLLALAPICWYLVVSVVLYMGGALIGETAEVSR